jgi:hypothetical protein
VECFSVMFDHEVDVYSLTTSTDAGGGVLNSYTLRQAGVACLLNVSAGGNPDLFGQEQQTDSVAVATFYTGAQRGDKLVVTAGNTFVGASLHVKNIRVQPGVATLGFDDICIFSCDRIA